MANSVAIPQDIIYQVIAAVGDDTELLKRCALVSSSFLIPSRKQLFSEIYLEEAQAAQRLHQCLIQNPVIQSFVRSIVIWPWTSRPAMQSLSYKVLNSTSLPAILRLPFCHLESFSIHFRHPYNWNNFSSELKDALSYIIHSSSLKALYLESVVNVPITLFLDIAHLTKLELISISPGNFDGMQSSSLTPTASKGVATAASHTVIDRCVWYFHGQVDGTRFPSTPAYFSLTRDMEGPTEPIFLPFMCRLRYFEINANPDSADMDDFNILSFLIRSLCVSLTSPATFEHLKLKICFCGHHNFDYRRLPEELRNADIWSHLNSIITRPIGSRLKRVDIEIKYTFRHGEKPDNNDEILKAVLCGLPLLRKKGILFVKAIMK
jgi:hypothetical protein